ncbi:hypothetical protein AALO_G00006870 [Alosa alosa]|uniref:C2 domain-containing protein n=1 Tax=Alosa alosa TaxID=278164 RepID=A0AAV6HI44_9TELE|nr:uncharacterized protein LOC125307036 isoform X1 [Alosa alosa]KAG5285740.1 hypothetical protein AALO_G00006870 [Alosa alosa]
MDAAQYDKGSQRASTSRAGSIPRRSTTGQSSQQTTNGIAQLLRGASPREQTDSDDEFEEDYFQTLVTRGAARGVLTVHVKDCRDFKNLSVKRGTQSFMRVSVGGKVKCTRLQPYNDQKANNGNNVAIAFNEWMYFSIRIPKEEERPLDTVHHIVVLELIFFEQDSGVPKLIGKTIVKLHDIMNKERAVMHEDLKRSRQVICKLDLEMVITYGTFGYGHSHQLQHPKRTMDSFVDRSLFLRCPPPDGRRDPRYNVLTPHPTISPYIDIIESLLKKESTGLDAPDSHHILPPPVMAQLQRRGRLLQLHETFQSYQNETDVIQGLEKIILKRGLQASSTWRQNKKSKKILNRWKNKANLIPKLLGFAAQDTKKSGPGQEATLSPRARSPLLAAVLKANRMKAAIEETDEPQPDSPPSPRVIFEQEQEGYAAPPAPLFRPGESLFPADEVPTPRRSAERERTEEEAVVSGMNSLSLSPENPRSSPVGLQERKLPTTTSSSRGTSPTTSPGQAGLSGPATSSPMGSFWGKLKGTGGTTELEEDVSPGISVPGRQDLPWLNSPAQPVTAAPPPVRPADPSSQSEEDPTEMWLQALASIPSLSSMLSDKDLEPIRGSLAFSPPHSDPSPQEAGSTSLFTGSGGRRPKPGRDKLKTMEGSNAPYRKQSHPR